MAFCRKLLRRRNPGGSARLRRVAHVGLVVNYRSFGLNLPRHENLAARMNDAVKMASMLSSVALTPSAYLTRLGAPSEASKVDAPTKKRRKPASASAAWTTSDALNSGLVVRVARHDKSCDALRRDRRIGRRDRLGGLLRFESRDAV
jgi:hypothetical protein